MALFKDSKGREWDLVLDGPTAIEIRELDPEFLKGDPQHTLERLQGDAPLMCLVIHAGCRKQLREREVSDEDFYRSILGDGRDAASDALVDALFSFSPSHQRKAAALAATKMNRAREVATAKVMTQLGNPDFDKQMEASLESEIDKAFQKVMTQFASVMSTPASAESAPAASVSAS